ncbi:MAG: primosomal protein N' [Gammaproteobacteria bacterium]
MSSTPCILRVALNTPLRRWFDYLPPDDCDIASLVPGQRLRVPFGKGKERVGLLLEITNKSEITFNKLKKISEIIDQRPIYNHEHLKLLEWASHYYHHPIGEVTLKTLPALLRQGTSPTIKREYQWRPTHAGLSFSPELLKSAPKQQSLLKFIQQCPNGISRKYLQENFLNWHTPLNKLIGKGFVESFINNPQETTETKEPEHIRLNAAQKKAADVITATLDHYQAYLLNGVTGSGKTEVYLQCISHVIRAGKQALILLPEIGLTPQFIERFQQHSNTCIAVMHSGLSDRERLNTWLKTRNGEVQVILGTRSAIWLPLHQVGIIIVDEEHDLSYKQQDGFRYSARDMALIRGQRENIPVILGSATPSMETLQNVATDRHQELKLPERAGVATPPHIKILDMRGNEMHGAFSKPLLDAIAHCLANKQQVLLFHNRRGYAPVVMCHDCGLNLKCSRCNTHLIYHKQKKKLCCHHCGHEEKIKSDCPDCAGKLVEVGYGTERLAETLTEYFPQASILRIDRDTTRKKGAMQTIFDTIHSGDADILIGTQMLAKGHHFPKVTLVGIVDADRGLFSADYRASERMAQIITQVSGRAGRAKDPGMVIIQTHHPEHPLLVTLIRDGYNKFAELVLLEREQTGLPPFSYHALLRAEANNILHAEKFLDNAKSQLQGYYNQKIELFGPAPALMEKRAGRYRLQLLIQAKKRNNLRNILQPWVIGLERLPSARKVRWSLDIDPQDIL